MIKPEALYAAGTLRLGNEDSLENFEKKERKIIKKMLGPKFQDNQRRLIPNNSNDKFEFTLI